MFRHLTAHTAALLPVILAAGEPPGPGGAGHPDEDAGPLLCGTLASWASSRRTPPAPADLLRLRIQFSRKAYWLLVGVGLIFIAVYLGVGYYPYLMAAKP